jgi:Mg-chelatase subunit ChlD
MSELSERPSQKPGGSLSRIAALRANLERATGAPLTGSSDGRAVVWLLLDTSGSMKNKMAAAAEGAVEFAQGSQRKGYRVGLIGFNSQARICAKPSAEDRDLVQALGSFRASGSTNMAGALALAEEELAGFTSRRAVALVTDGSPDDRDAALQMRDRLVRKGVEILTLAVSGADEKFLARMATSRELAVQASVATLRSGVANLAGLLR